MPDGSGDNYVNFDLFTVNQDLTLYAQWGSLLAGVALDPNTKQTIEINDLITITASIQPADASSKEVKWTVIGLNPDAVKLYADAECKQWIPSFNTTFAQPLIVYAKGISAGTAVITCTATNGNYIAEDDKKASLQVAVNKPAASVTKAPEANSLFYTGEAQTLVTAGKASGGTMQYALGTDATTAPAEGWSISIPAQTDSGTYYVWYKAVGDANHKDSEPESVMVVIAEKVVYTILLYGSNMKSGAMFGHLRKYAMFSYYYKHRTFQFDTLYEEGQYAIFAVANVCLTPGRSRFVSLPGIQSSERETRQKGMSTA